MKNNYFSSIADSNTGYLLERPTKNNVLNNAKVAGNAMILPNSNNRALIIKTGEKVFLQSYDTLILEVDKETKVISKLWDAYSVTTLKHINDFLSCLDLHISFSKKEWQAFKGTTIA